MILINLSYTVTVTYCNYNILVVWLYLVVHDEHESMLPTSSQGQESKHQKVLALGSFVACFCGFLQKSTATE